MDVHNVVGKSNFCVKKEHLSIRTYAISLKIQENVTSWLYFF